MRRRYKPYADIIVFQSYKSEVIYFGDCIAEAKLYFEVATRDVL